MHSESSSKDYTLTFFNTLNRKKEVFKPVNNNQVRIYTCGPTVYNYAHIGNFRTYVFEDLLRRTLKFFGLTVHQVMNLTDVDDKTIRGALKEGLSLDAFTKRYKEAFFEDIGILGIERAEHYPAATDYIPQMIEMIELLIEKGFAYKGGDESIYYSIQRFPQYGCLSHLKLEDLKSGASERVAADEYDKDNASDFVLWKAHDPERDGDIYWDSPFGKGRPGWHLECSAMAMSLLGESIDIHMGGVDNIFPHHENEIAQSEACSGKTFARFWLHAEHLIVNGKKMSKSLGNFYTLRDLLEKGFSGVEVRYMLLQAHYRTQLNFTLDELSALRSSLHRLNTFIQRMQKVTRPDGSEEADQSLQWAYERFASALADDLNISVALAALFDMVREINGLDDAGKLSQEEAESVLELLKRFNQVLGILSFEEEKAVVPSEIEEALAKREQARKDKDWALADQLRAFILDSGYVIEDTPTGPRVQKG